MTEKQRHQRIRWAITRLRRLFELWDRFMDVPDKEYCLRRIRDKEPMLFYAIASERREGR